MSSVFLIFTVFLIYCLGNEANAVFGFTSRERDALSTFKASLSDPSDRLSSWNVSTDCCKWHGIECDQLSGQVIALDLRNKRYGDSYPSSSSSANMLHSEALDSSLLDLNMLSFLDLSGNNFHRASIPSFLGLMNQMQHLNLSHSNFSGVVPHHLGNLSSLSVLDLSYNQLIVDDFTWVSHLSLLKHLNMSSVDLSPTNDFLKVLNMLPFLTDLRMSESEIENRNLQHACVNSKLRHIEYLDLRSNNFHGSLPCFLENMTSLKYLLLSFNNYNSCDQNHLFKLTNLVRLSLGYNSLQCNADSISEFILDKPHLEYLSLQNNSCNGDISEILLNLSRYPDPKLKNLDLAKNNFYGQLPQEIGRIRSLQRLYLDHNLISGPIPASIGNLSDLNYLGLSGNQLSGLIPSSLGNLSALTLLYLHSNELSGKIPTSISNLSALEYLYLSSNQLNGEIHVSFFDSLAKLRYLRIGTNSLKFVARSDWIPPFQLVVLQMGSLEIGGVFPQWIHTQKKLLSLSMPNCSISGEMPESLCEMKSLVALSLAGNNLSGSLPECVGNLNMLRFLDLSSNNLSGVIPNSTGGAYSLGWLRLSNNRFSGEIPYDLRNCTQLEVLDIGENEISGKLPNWIGIYLLNLKVLQLSSNKVYGMIPSNLCQLSGLQILDLAINNFTGNIPHCIHNFTHMVFENSSMKPFEWYVLYNLRLIAKGVELDYLSTLIRHVVYMDLSSNNLVGKIPLELTTLVALRFLNLSHNHLQGHIPQRIGDMNSLESLDLSNNNISGNIPKELSKLTFLSHLNLSHNKLTGEIPAGNQLQTLVDPSIYDGNPGLCGAPLPKKCHEDRAPPNLENHDVEGEEDKIDRIWLYGIVISGFATGFWGAIGVLVFKIRWRHVYFRFTDEIIARIFGA